MLMRRWVAYASAAVLAAPLLGAAALERQRVRRRHRLILVGQDNFQAPRCEWHADCVATAH